MDNLSAKLSELEQMLREDFYYDGNLVMQTLMEAQEMTTKKLPEGVSVSDARVVYSQGSGVEDNTLEIKTQDCGAGVYYVLKTDGFEFDSVEELTIILKDFENRVK